MNESRVIVKRVISFCSLPEELIPETHWLCDYPTGCYVEYSLENLEVYNELQDWIAKNYQELDNTEFLIHMDY